jgi:hypothetical protein
MVDFSVPLDRRVDSTMFCLWIFEFPAQGNISFACSYKIVGSIGNAVI